MYRHAPEVHEIAAGLIESVPEHKDLDGCRIEYVFIDKAPKSKGRAVWGRARKLGGLPAFIAAGHPVDELFVVPRAMFVIEISWNIWLYLDEGQRVALVDHELCHCVAVLDEDDELVLSTRPHDFEEFRGVIDRHGLWNSSSTALGATIADQLVLAIDSVTEFVGNLGTTPPEGETGSDDGESSTNDDTGDGDGSLGV